MATYPKNNNPVCPYSGNDCNSQDMDGYTDCRNCPDYGNGVRATGAMPGLEAILKDIKSLLKTKKS